MEPKYAHGDRVVTFNWTTPKIGDIITFELDNKYYIKRIERISGDLIYVSGDNKSQTALFEPVDKVKVVGKVVFKY